MDDVIIDTEYSLGSLKRGDTLEMDWPIPRPPLWKPLALWRWHKGPKEERRKFVVDCDVVTHEVEPAPLVKPPKPPIHLHALDWHTLEWSGEFRGGLYAEVVFESECTIWGGRALNIDGVEYEADWESYQGTGYGAGQKALVRVRRVHAAGEES